VGAVFKKFPYNPTGQAVAVAWLNFGWVELSNRARHGAASQEDRRRYQELYPYGFWSYFNSVTLAKTRLLPSEVNHREEQDEYLDDPYDSTAEAEEAERETMGDESQNTMCYSPTPSLTSTFDPTDNATLADDVHFKLEEEEEETR
jgi:hypothetical protein